MKRRLAFSTILGFAIGIACILFAIMGAGHLKSFWNLPSIFITIGGTVGAMVVSYPPALLKLLGPTMWKSLQSETYDFMGDIDTIVGLSEIARRQGILALEKSADEHVGDRFLHKGILLIADGVGENALRPALQAEMYFMRKRHKQGHDMLDTIAATTPALGLLGTYVGLIPMLESLEDPASLGPLMAVELVSSFYGAFVAYIVFSPMSKKLKIMSSSEMMRNELILEGLISIQNGENPRYIREKLLSILTNKEIARMQNGGGRARSRSNRKEEVA